MPLVPSPSTGYTDYQTFGNYDSSLLWSIDSFLGTSPVSSPVMNMTKYAALSGFLLCVTNQCQGTITWYGDAGLTQIIASRTFTLTQNITSGFGALIVPNMGAYAQIVCSNMGGVAFAVNTLIFGTNRQVPVEWSPQFPYLIDQQAIAIGAGATVQLYPSDYYAGPMAIWGSFPQAGFQLSMQVLTVAGNWDFVNQLPTTTGAGVQAANWTAPIGAWRLQLGNSGAATTYYLSVIPSISGAT